jgi:L-threonylcarbamoyladenylate synthase
MKLGKLDELLKIYGSQRVGVLTFNKSIDQVPAYNQIDLSPRGDLEDAAQRLFAALRTLDKLDVDIILAGEVPDVGLGKAINDRLRRAAAD